jgi:hypothetical protein
VHTREDETKRTRNGLADAGETSQSKKSRRSILNITRDSLSQKNPAPGNELAEVEKATEDLYQPMESRLPSPPVPKYVKATHATPNSIKSVGELIKATGKKERVEDIFQATSAEDTTDFRNEFGAMDQVRDTSQESTIANNNNLGIDRMNHTVLDRHLLASQDYTKLLPQ